MELQIGEEYQVNHSRKGRFAAVVKTVDDTWATLELTAGKANAMCSYNEAEAGEEITVRLSHCTFTMMDRGPIPAQATAERVCKHLPEGFEIHLCMEHGAAWVKLLDAHGDSVELPDSADKSIDEQLNDALCVATGWTNPPIVTRQSGKRSPTPKFSRAGTASA